MPEKRKLDYPEEYRGILKFSDFSEALKTLIMLRKYYKAAALGGNKKRLQDIKKVAEVGERRASGIARNPKVEPSLKREKGEIALWFNVWRENPRVFNSWLALRIGSEDFLSAFGEEAAETVRDLLSRLEIATHDP
jgi:hypothetical protein